MNKKLVVGIILFSIGLWFSLNFAISLILCGIIAPTAIGWQITWLVNSGNHMWGSRPNNTGDSSTNNFWIAVLTFGEGWHNNHHAVPWSARHGWTWKQLDLNYAVILLFEKLGWATKLRLANVTEK
jgi:stearoyl-CoA desaturase (delta-9 desaturase)